MIIIPERIWKEMLVELQKETRALEQVCYLDGVRIAGTAEGVVTTVTFPDAHLEPGRFTVTPAAMSQAGKHLRRSGLRRLAQVHTHPGKGTGHSDVDDSEAYSQLPGAISIVLPHYGKRKNNLSDAGVHLRTEKCWRELDTTEISAVVRIVPSTFDFRANARFRPSRRYTWRQILTFWRR